MTEISLGNPVKPPAIEAVVESVQRTFWSVMIPTYNKTKYLEETLRSVLEQDPGSDEMQIEVIDNCSTEGNPEEIVTKVGKGRVSFARQPYNVGMAGNWNACINRAKGEWVHILHDDDRVLPGFYSRLRVALEKERSVGAALCRYINMDKDGHWQNLSLLEMPNSAILLNWVERLNVGNIQCPAIVVRRSVYEKLGGFYLELKYMPDFEMWRRIALHYPFWYEPQALACYRYQHSESQTTNIFKTNLPIADGYMAISLLKPYLAGEIGDRILRKLRKQIEIFSIVIIRHNIALGQINVAIHQMQELIKLDFSFTVVKGLFRTLWLIGKHYGDRMISLVISLVKKYTLKQSKGEENS